MQGSKQQYAQQSSTQEAALAFKRFILDETAAFEETPEADLFRVNALAQMLDRYDDYAANGADVPSAIRYVLREYANLAARMREEGFEGAEKEGERTARWPALSEEEAAHYLKEAKHEVHRRAIGIALCSACCLPLLMMIGIDIFFTGHAGDVSSLLGVCGMFGMIAMGVYAIVTAKKPENKNKIRKKRFSLSARLRKKLSAMQEMTHEKSRRRRGRGIALLVACVLPVFLGAALDSFFGLLGVGDPYSILGVGGMFAMIGVGVYEVICANGDRKAIDKLLKN